MRELLEKTLTVIERDGDIKYSTTQVQMPYEIEQKVLNYGNTIPDSEVYTAEDGFGREDDIHCTAKYGIHSSDGGRIADAIRGFGPIKGRLGPITLFIDDAYDVVIIPVESDDLVRLNQLICDTEECTDTHPDYKPHITIAYLNPGEGQKYLDDNTFNELEFDVDEVVFSNVDNERTTMGTLS